MESWVDSWLMLFISEYYELLCYSGVDYVGELGMKMKVCLLTVFCYYYCFDFDKSMIWLMIDVFFRFALVVTLAVECILLLDCDWFNLDFIIILSYFYESKSFSEYSFNWCRLFFFLFSVLPLYINQIFHLLIVHNAKQYNMQQHITKWH